MDISTLDNTTDLFHIDRDGTSMTVNFGEIGEPDDLSLARLREQYTANYCGRSQHHDGPV